MEIVALVNLTGVAIQRGLLDEATSHTMEALALVRAMGWRKAEGEAFECLGVIAYLRGQLAEAGDYCQRALDIFHETSAHSRTSRTLAYLADINRA